MKKQISWHHVDHAAALQVLTTTVDFFDVSSLSREADVFPQTMI